MLLSHAIAKAAMFMAAGNILRFGGHDSIADLDRIVQRLTFLVQHLPEGAIQLNSSEFKDVISRNAPLGAPWADSPEVGAASTI